MVSIQVYSFVNYWVPFGLIAELHLISPFTLAVTVDYAIHFSFSLAIPYVSTIITTVTPSFVIAAAKAFA